MEPSNTAQPAISSYSDWFANAYRLAVRQWPIWLLVFGIQFALMMLVVGGLLGAVLFAAGGLLLPDIVARSLQVLQDAGLILLGAVVLVLQLIGAWANATVTLALTHGSAQQGPIGATFGRALRLVWRAFALTLLIALICMGAALACFVPVLLVAPGLLLAWYIGLLEPCSVADALGQSWARSRGVRLEILGRFLLLLFMFFGASMALSLFSAIPVVGLIGLPLQFVLQAVFPVMVLALGYVVYLDLRPVYSADAPAPAGKQTAPWFLYVLFCLGALSIVGVTLALRSLGGSLPTALPALLKGLPI